MVANPKDRFSRDMAQLFMHVAKRNRYVGFLMINKGYFSLVLHKNICSRYPLESPHEAILMSTNNICFYGEIQKCLPSCLQLCFSVAVFVLFSFFGIFSLQSVSMQCTFKVFVTSRKPEVHLIIFQW